MALNVETTVTVTNTAIREYLNQVLTLYYTIKKEPLDVNNKNKIRLSELEHFISELTLDMYYDVSQNDVVLYSKADPKLNLLYISYFDVVMHLKYVEKQVLREEDMDEASINDLIQFLKHE